jgi:hypothetical protein
MSQVTEDQIKAVAAEVLMAVEHSVLANAGNLPTHELLVMALGGIHQAGLCLEAAIMHVRQAYNN